MRTRSWLFALAGLACAPPAFALNFALHPYVQVGGLWDTNVFRYSSGTEAASVNGSRQLADWVYRYDGGIDSVITESLQQLQLSADFGRDNYTRFSQLSNNHFATKDSLHLSLANRLTSTTDYSYFHTLQPYYSVNLANRDQRGFYSQTDEAQTLAYALTPEINLKARMDHSRLRYSLLTSASLNLDETGEQFNAEYQEGELSALGLVARQVQGNHGGIPSPLPTALATTVSETTYTQRTFGTYLSYAMSGVGQFTWNLGYTQRFHHDPRVQDFHGPTGKISYKRVISGRTFVQVDLYRELLTLTSVGANFVSEIGAEAFVNYQLTDKIAPQLTYQYFVDRYSASVASGEGGRVDGVHAIVLALPFNITPRLVLRGSVRVEAHMSNAAGQEFHDNALDLNLKYTY